MDTACFHAFIIYLCSTNIRKNVEDTTVYSNNCGCKHGFVLRKDSAEEERTLS